MRLIKPIKMGFLQRTFGLAEDYNYVASPIVFFDLQTSEILTENVQWAKIAKALGAQPLDHALPKTTGEFFLAGHAYPPEENMKEMQVSLSVGDKTKQLNIFGKGQWRRNFLGQATKSKRESISKVAIDYVNAYGGGKSRLNPVGTGFDYASPLAQIESLNKTFSSPGQKIPPAGLGPIPITWPQRAKYHGTYKGKWFDKYFPALPPDSDLRLFNCAPADQQYPDFFRGDEKFVINGMHLDHPEVKGKLPAIKARCFSIYNGDFREMPLVLDTVWFMPDQSVGVLIFRGTTRVKNTEANEISDIMLAYENLSDKPKTVQHYQNTFELRTNPATAAANIMNERALSPELSEQVLLTNQQKIGIQKQTKIDELKQIQADRTPQSLKALVIEQPAPELTALDELLNEDVEQGDIDLTSVIKQNEAQVEKVQEKAETSLAKVNAFSRLESTKPELTKQGPIASLNIELAMANFNGTPSDNNAEQQKLLAQQWAIQPQDEIAVSPDAAMKLRAMSLQNIKNGESFILKNLTGVDFSELEFNNIDFSQSILSFSNLAGARFNHCNFSASTFCNANITESSFNQCNLSESNFSGAKGDKVKFDQCDMKASIWRSSSVILSKFLNCELQQILFLKCNLKHNIFQSSSLLKNIFSQCQLNDSDFLDCKINQATFSESMLQLTRWYKSQFERCVLQLCEANLASFIDCQAHKLIFSTGTVLTKANFSNAKCELTSFRNVSAQMLIANSSRFITCDFSLADLSESHFSNSKLIRCISTKTKFIESVISHCNCYRSGFRSALFVACQLENINFLDADLMWAEFQQCNLDNCINLSKVATRDQKKRGGESEQNRITRSY